MNGSSRYIVAAGAFIGCVGSLYFLSLFFLLPFWLTVACGMGALYVLLRWFIYKGITKDTVPVSKLWQWISALLLAAGLWLIAGNAITLAMKYGGWDASGVWNFDAQYLVDPVNWKKLFQNVRFSPGDYPLCLPATIAFFMRLLSSDSTVIIPFVLSILCSLCVPVLIYQEVARRNIAVAAATLLLFVYEQYYITAGVSQYADIWVAFFLLCAFVCSSYARADKRYVALSAFFLGCCAWTKNEGSIPAIIFLGWYGALFFSKSNVKYTLAGLALPLCSLIILKMFCGAQGGVGALAGAISPGVLLQKERYAAVLSSYITNVGTNFMGTAIAVCLYAVLCVVMKRRPGRAMLVLLSCMIVHFMIYVVIPGDQGWNLATSQSRLMLQLMPALVYVMGMQVAEKPES
jgi:hypothetical protein